MSPARKAIAEGVPRTPSQRTQCRHCPPQVTPKMNNRKSNDESVIFERREWLKTGKNPTPDSALVSSSKRGRQDAGSRGCVCSHDLALLTPDNRHFCLIRACLQGLSPVFGCEDHAFTADLRAKLPCKERIPGARNRLITGTVTGGYQDETANKCAGN